MVHAPAFFLKDRIKNAHRAWLEGRKKSGHDGLGKNEVFGQANTQEDIDAPANPTARTSKFYIDRSPDQVDSEHGGERYGKVIYHLESLLKSRRIPPQSRRKGRQCNEQIPQDPEESNRHPCAKEHRIRWLMCVTNRTQPRACCTGNSDQTNSSSHLKVPHLTLLIVFVTPM